MNLQKKNSFKEKKGIFIAVLGGICLLAVVFLGQHFFTDSGEEPGKETPVEAGEQEGAVQSEAEGQEEDLEETSASWVGKPCHPEKSGWNLEEAVDAQGEKWEKLWQEGEDKATYLLEQKENYTLYGSGDLEKMLLRYGDAYAEICYPYTSNYRIAPALMEQDYDGDGQQELAIRVTVMHGTGVYIETLLMADREEEGLFVYQYLDSDFFDVINSHLTYERNQGEPEGLQAYLDGSSAGMAADEEGMNPFSHCGVGSQARFQFDEFPAPGENYGDIRLWTDLEFYTEESVIACFNGNSICTDVIYLGKGEFSLENFQVRNSDLESAVTKAVEEQFGLEPEGRKFVADIQYDGKQTGVQYSGPQLSGDTVEVKVILKPQIHPDIYEEAWVTMKRSEPESGSFWEAEEIVIKR